MDNQTADIKVAIFATHPIQYQVPWFRALAGAAGIRLKVYYALLPDENQQGIGFNVPFQWDIPMLEGYPWEVLPNTSRSPNLGRFFGANTPGVATALSRDRPDIAIITGWQSWSLVQALAACIRMGIPRLIRAESNALRKRPWWLGMVHRALLSSFDGFLEIGRANREFYLGNGTASSRIFPCHYFVDNDRIRAQFESYAAERESLRAGWGIPPDSVCFLFVGKIQEKKRPMDLLRAVMLAKTSNPNIHVLVVGSGELMEEAQKWVEREGLPVTFAGFLNQTELPKAYAAGDCLVLPSDYGETWGLVVNEAMVCGLPAIVSDRVGCGPDLVQDGATGAVAPFGDIEGLACRMVEFASDKPRLVEMGVRARDRVAEYSVGRAVEGTIQGIRAVLGR